MIKMRKILKTILIFAIFISVCNLSKAYNQIEYSETEKTYIEKNSKIYVAGNPDLSPIEGFKNDRYVGIIPDIFKKISKITGLDYIYINESENWEKYIKNNQVEIVSGVENVNFEKMNLQNKIELVKYPYTEENNQVSIVFTSIANDELISITKKAIDSLDRFDWQEIIESNVTEHEKRQEKNKNRILKFLVIFILTVAIIYIILYKKYRKEAKNAKYIDNITHEENYQKLEKDYNTFVTDENRCASYVASLGIDFNHIEQIYGYSEVEKVLKNVAKVLKDNLDYTERFARIFKSNFIIIGNKLSESLMLEKMNNLLTKIKEHDENSNYELNMNIGIYFPKVTDKNLQNAVYKAMQARNEAKKQNTNVKICTDAFIMKIDKRNAIEKELVNAVNNKEFTTYAQMLLNLNDNTTSELEILARWDSEKFGFVKPRSFLNVLEDNNIVDKLDFQMLESACKMLSQRKMSNKDLYTIFCNFSRQTITKDNFMERINNIILKYDISKKYIGIIINSSNTSNEFYIMKYSIEKLRKNGYIVLLDDFDTLIYSIRELNELPVNYIKISSRLMENIKDEKTLTIAKGLIETAHSLGIKVICEDFGTQENKELLKQIKCDIVQGNKYFQPLPLEEIM